MLCQVIFDFFLAMESFEEILLLIKAVYRESERQLTEAFHSLGITPAQAEALFILQQTGPLSLGELGDFLIAEGGHPSRLVNRLFQAGLVERQEASNDRRRLEISLTEEGRIMARQVNQIKQTMLQDTQTLMEKPDIQYVRKFLLHYLDLKESRWREILYRRYELAEKSEQRPE